MQQADGIRAARHGHANRVATLEHVITKDGFGDLFEHSVPASLL
jgi:hypothetical protein